MQDEAKLQQLEAKYRSLVPLMDEHMRRQWAATEARAYGWGGVRAVSGVIGMSPNTITKGLSELAAREEHPDAPLDAHLRRKGGGRKRSSEADPLLAPKLRESAGECAGDQINRTAGGVGVNHAHGAGGEVTHVTWVALRHGAAAPRKHRRDARREQGKNLAPWRTFVHSRFPEFIHRQPM